MQTPACDVHNLWGGVVGLDHSHWTVATPNSPKTSYLTVLTKILHCLHCHFLLTVPLGTGTTLVNPPPFRYPCPSKLPLLPAILVPAHAIIFLNKNNLRSINNNAILVRDPMKVHRHLD